MDMTQEVTFSIPIDLVQRTRRLAAQNQISLSELLTLALTAFIEYQEKDETARQRSIEMMRQGLNLGTNGLPEWTREDLHDRKV